MYFFLSQKTHVYISTRFLKSGYNMKKPCRQNNCLKNNFIFLIFLHLPEIKLYGFFL
jgi:hypothetical protein